MSLFNYTAKEIILKLVYYGPGFSGKTTNLQFLHTILPSDTKGKLISMATETDRTIFFDFLPVEMGKIKDFKLRFQLYTVPGQIRYNASRRLVLKGVDGIIFVADSQKEMKEQNIESLSNMRDNLAVNNIDPDIPVVFQYNKRDIENIMSVEELNSDLNKNNAPYFEAVAVEGRGVEDTFKETTKVLLNYIAKKHKIDIEASATPSAHRAAPVSAPVSKLFPQEAKKPSVVPAYEPQPFKRSEPQPSKFPAIEKTIKRPSPAASSDSSELISAIGEVKVIMSEISLSLKEMQRRQAKSVDLLLEFKRIFSEARDKKGFFKRLFG